MRLLGLAIRLRMARADRDASETEPPQLLANAALVQAHRKCHRNLVAEINAPPADHAVLLTVGTRAHPLGNLRQLFVR
jgi:hypothetical protein